MISEWSPRAALARALHRAAKLTTYGREVADLYGEDYTWITTVLDWLHGFVEGFAAPAMRRVRQWRRRWLFRKLTDAQVAREYAARRATEAALVMAYDACTNELASRLISEAIAAHYPWLHLAREEFRARHLANPGNGSAGHTR